MELEHFNPPEGSVILVRESSLDEETEEMFIAALMQRFPKSLIVILAAGMSFEAMEIEELEATLETTIEHKRATAGGISSD